MPAPVPPPRGEMLKVWEMQRRRIQEDQQGKDGKERVMGRRNDHVVE